jgi:hypothetical protein
MKYLFIIFSIVSISCISQETIDIEGNWYEDIKKTKADNYAEIFIDHESFSIYHELAGFSGSIDYVIENNILYHLFTNKAKKKQGVITFIDENTISIGDYIIFKRIDKGLKLEDFLRNNIPESEYLKSFNERRTAWEETHKD